MWTLYLLLHLVSPLVWTLYLLLHLVSPLVWTLYLLWHLVSHWCGPFTSCYIWSPHWCGPFTSCYIWSPHWCGPFTSCYIGWKEANRFHTVVDTLPIVTFVWQKENVSMLVQTLYLLLHWVGKGNFPHSCRPFTYCYNGLEEGESFHTVVDPLLWEEWSSPYSLL